MSLRRVLHAAAVAPFALEGAPVDPRWMPRRVPLPSGRFSVQRVPSGTGPAAGRAARAWTDPGDRTVRLTSAATRDDFRHELGHEFDFTVMDDAARAGFQKIMGLKGPWMGPGGGTPVEGSQDVPGEQFAEAYRSLASDRRLGQRGYIDTQPHYYGFAPSAGQYRRLRGLLGRTYRRAQLADVMKAGVRL